MFSILYRKISQRRTQTWDFKYPKKKNIKLIGTVINTQQYTTAFYISYFSPLFAESLDQ